MAVIVVAIILSMVGLAMDPVVIALLIVVGKFLPQVELQLLLLLLQVFV